MINQKRLKELVHYNPDTGLFFWLVSGSGRNPDLIAGCLNGVNSYIQIKIDGVLYRAHRLACLYQTGKWPEDQIDHIDRLPWNNRWKNLREATNKINNQNTSMQNNNTSGFTGVYLVKSSNKWCAQIMVDAKCIVLGKFTEKSDAITARKAANLKYGFHFNHGKNGLPPIQ